MCVAERGQQAKRLDVKTFKRGLRDEEEMLESIEGARALPADPLPVRTIFRIVFGTLFFHDFSTLWFQLGVHFPSIIFASLFRRWIQH